jgi:KipI family sensor histidine kinase inhibitor
MNTSARHLSSPRFLLAGDAALVIEFGQALGTSAIDPAINRRVHALAHALAEHPQPGLGEAVPTYRSLLLHYDPLQLSHAQVVALVSEALQAREKVPPPEPRLIEIPTIYGGEHGPDIAFVAEHSGLTVEDVVRLHAEATYTVYMLGFTPGFPYLGGLPDALATPRLGTPRKRVPAGSVGIAGAQTGIYPLATPGGWRLIGWTPVVLFDPSRTPPALLQPGDRVRFVPIEEGATLGA